MGNACAAATPTGEEQTIAPCPVAEPGTLFAACETQEATPATECGAEPRLQIEFLVRGCAQTLDFAYTPLGFDFGQQAPGCCGGKRTQVKVTKVCPSGQAAALGLSAGAVISRVNGREITELEHLKDAIADAGLPAREVESETALSQPLASAKGQSEATKGEDATTETGTPATEAAETK